MTLKLAIPSKGRLKEQTEEFFAASGFPIEGLGGARGYQAQATLIRQHLPESLWPENFFGS